MGRVIVVLGLLAAGCAPQDTGFGTGTDDPVGQTGDPIAEITPAELVWTDVDVGYSFVEELTITNVGDGDLAIYEIAILTDPSEAFLLDTAANITLEPAAQQSWQVTCDLATDAVAEGTLRVRTNDPAATEVVVPMTCTPTTGT